MNRGFTYKWEKNKSLISPGERDLENEYGEIRALEREREKQNLGTKRRKWEEARGRQWVSLVREFFSAMTVWER